MNSIYVLDSLQDILNILKNDAEKNLFCEICGFVGVTKNKKYIYKRIQNRSKSPDSYFIMDPYDFLNFIKDYSLLTIFHSHLFGDEQYSEFDAKTSENCCVPFLIYSVTTEKFCIYEPQYKDYDVNIIERLKELI